MPSGICDGVGRPPVGVVSAIFVVVVQRRFPSSLPLPVRLLISSHPDPDRRQAGRQAKAEI